MARSETALKSAVPAPSTSKAVQVSDDVETREISDDSEPDVSGVQVVALPTEQREREKARIRMAKEKNEIPAKVQRVKHVEQHFDDLGSDLTPLFLYFEHVHSHIDDDAEEEPFDVYSTYDRREACRYESCYISSFFGRVNLAASGRPEADFTPRMVFL